MLIYQQCHFSDDLTYIGRSVIVGRELKVVSRMVLDGYIIVYHMIHMPFSMEYDSIFLKYV